MPDYAKIYFHNRYEVVIASDTIFPFSLQHFNDDPFFDRPFGIVTAFNPYNKTLSIQENLLRNRLLYSELNSKFELLEAKGCLNEHCEEGYLIYDITLSELIKIGRSYEQFAIFYNTTTKLEYIECKSKKVIVEKERKAPKSR